MSENTVSSDKCESDGYDSQKDATQNNGSGEKADVKQEDKPTESSNNEQLATTDKPVSDPGGEVKNTAQTGTEWVFSLNIHYSAYIAILLLDNDVT